MSARSDFRAGRVDAVGTVLPGASWQRCRTHHARNLLSQVPKSAQPWVATLLRTVFEQPDADAVQARMRHVPDTLEAKFPKAAEHLDAARHDLLAFTAFPRKIWRRIWSNCENCRASLPCPAWPGPWSNWHPCLRIDLPTAAWEQSLSDPAGLPCPDTGLAIDGAITVLTGSPRRPCVFDAIKDFHARDRRPYEHRAHNHRA